MKKHGRKITKERLKKGFENIFSIFLYIGYMVFFFFKIIILLIQTSNILAKNSSIQVNSIMSRLKTYTFDNLYDN